MVVNARERWSYGIRQTIYICRRFLSGHMLEN